MKRYKKILLGTLCVLIIAGGIVCVPTVWGKPWKIEHFYARVFIEFMLEHPEMLSQMRIFEPFGVDFHNDDLDDYSIAATHRELRMAEKNLEMLRRYDRDKLEDKLSYDVLEFFLIDMIAVKEFAFHNYPVNQMGGVQSSLPDFMINYHVIGDINGAENYIARLSKFGIALDQVIKGLKHRQELGIVPPRFVIKKVLKEMRDFIAPPPRKTPLFTHFDNALKEIEGLSPEKANALKEQVAKQIEQTVSPAYRRMIDHHEQLESKATDDDGVWKLPNGDRYYANRLRSHTTISLDPDEIHGIGLREVKKFRTEMLEILHGMGKEGDNIGAIMQDINLDPRFLYPETDQGRAQVLTDYQKIIDDIDKNIDHLFNRRPKSHVRVIRVPVFKQATAPGAYYMSPPLDDSRPGSFYVNLRDMKEIPKFSMRTLAYHEAVPGHHFQIALAQENEDVPFFRKVIPFTAYVEGWALYTERLAAENKFMDDPHDRLGYLISEMFRSVRLVVDTGIHDKHWTREKAINYMLTNTGMPEGDIVSEVERYIVDPGQACAYKIGQMKIVELRERAKNALGDRFDIREFHNVVLRHGALPLSLLERVVNEWINDR
ncbi:MAG: DUF885 domain-containing protein [Proteobacteria bacterium]|nr:DUF885 domain-containing protein [Pseudomonadota bacterium]